MYRMGQLYLVPRVKVVSLFLDLLVVGFLMLAGPACITSFLSLHGVCSACVDKGT